MFKAILRALFGLPRRRSAPRRHEPRRHYDLDEGDESEDDDEDYWSTYRLPRHWSKRIRPEGSWRRTGEWPGITVKGTRHTVPAVQTFVDAILDAENDGNLERFPFSVALEADPDNSFDRNAIKVMGQIGARPGKLHLGYLPRDLAAKLVGQELPPIEVTHYFEKYDFSYIGLNISILERVVTSADVIAEEIARLDHVGVAEIEIDRAKDPAIYLGMARSLKRADRREEAEALLEKLIEALEPHGRAPPAAWRELAILFRQRKDYQAEVRLLERFAAGLIPPGTAGEKLISRLHRARELSAKEK